MNIELYFTLNFFNGILTSHHILYFTNYISLPNKLSQKITFLFHECLTANLLQLVFLASQQYKLHIVNTWGSLYI